MHDLTIEEVRRRLGLGGCDDELRQAQTMGDLSGTLLMIVAQDLIGTCGIDDPDNVMAARLCVLAMAAMAQAVGAGEVYDEAVTDVFGEDWSCPSP